MDYPGCSVRWPLPGIPSPPQIVRCSRHAIWFAPGLPARRKLSKERVGLRYGSLTRSGILQYSI
jgi:hypothetical protein